MKTRLEFEVETLREMCKASIDALEEVSSKHGGLTAYVRGYRDSRFDVLKILDRILEEVSE